MINNLVSLILRGISLLLLNIITFVLILSVWEIKGTTIFPWAFSVTILSLIFINLAIIISDKIMKIYGIVSYAGVISSSLIYYIYIMIFTGATYDDISTMGYLIAILIGTLVYFSIISGLYVSSIHKNRDTDSLVIEQKEVMNLNLLLRAINESINYCKDFLSDDNVIIINHSFHDMNERLKASTPFGRTSKSGVLDMETQIKEKLSVLQNEITLLKSEENNQNKCKYIAQEFQNIKELIIDRERLMLH
ncbi:hypothetical protein ACNQFZ_08405 [Schinkia sp. CFF1]